MFPILIYNIFIFFYILYPHVKLQYTHTIYLTHKLLLHN